MNKHEKELKKPDAFIVEGRKILFFLEKNIRALLVGSAVLVLVIGGLLLVGNASEKKEQTLQSEYYRIEKSYLKKQEDAEKAKLEKLEKSDKSDKKTKDLAAQDKQDKQDKKEAGAEENSAVKYSSEISDFKALIEKAPESKAAAMAALTVAHFYFENKTWEEGLKVLESVYSRQKKDNLIKGLLAHSLGVAQANVGKCDLAVRTWESLMKVDTYSFMTDEIKLKIAVCQQELGKAGEAEKLLSEVKAKPDSPQSKVAEKYLRFFKNKKQGS